jgi:hypothetical protein
MTEIALKGPPLDELEDYAIAYVDLSQGYVGRLVSYDHMRRVADLDDAWVLVGGYQLGQQGAGRMRACLPIEMLTDLKRIQVGYSTLLVLDELSDADFREIATGLKKSIAIAEELRASVRTQRSGLVLAPAGTKLPPITPRVQ